MSRAAPLAVTLPEGGRAAAFRVLRNFLDSADYREGPLCRRLEIEDVFSFVALRDGRQAARDIGGPLDVLVRLFLDTEAVAVERVREHIPDPALEAMRGLGLLRPDAPEGRVAASVLLYPVEGVRVISDPPGTRDDLPADAVYPAITAAARDFLTAVPRTPAGRVLELCSGTGIGALVSAPVADEVCAVDITERATRFAEFNAALNGIDHLTALRGDLWEPVEGRRFDRILAHPPYMQALEMRHIFRDAGEDGEQVTRKILRDLERHLAPGGRFYCTALLTGRRGVPPEARVREMLGPDTEGLDVALFRIGAQDPLVSLFRQAVSGRIDLEETRAREAAFRRLGVDELVYCTLAVQRSGTTRPGFTTVRARGPGTGAAEIDWLLDFETAAADPGFHAALGSARPVASPRARLDVEHRRGDEGWVAERYTVRVDRPFPAQLRCPPWVAELIAAADGGRTLREHLERLRAGGSVPEDGALEDFLRMVAPLLGTGLLEIEALPLPPAARRSA